MVSNVAKMTPLSIDDNWRRWIAENLMLDNSPESLFDALIANGADPNQARHELAAALASPYLHGAQRMRNRLAKRDWILDCRRKLNRIHPDDAHIPRRHQLDSETFLREHYVASRPVIITGMLDDWPARTKWNLRYFHQQFGEREVEVQFGRDSDARYEINGAQHKRKMRFSEYLDLVAMTESSNDFYMTANNGSQNQQALRELWQDIGPLSEYLNPQAPEKGFFWLGPKGTRTPFHHDLTNNFMAQLVGRKRVLLIPACETPYMYNTMHCYSDVDAAAINRQMFPLFDQVQVLECVLEPGELLFLPIGCWHYVEALDKSVTMSFVNFRWDNDFSSIYHTYHDV